MPTNLYLVSVDLTEPLKDCEQRLRLLLQRDYLLEALKQVHGSIGDAAQLLGVSRRSVTAWVSHFKINVEQFYPAVRRERLALKRGMDEAVTNGLGECGVCHNPNCQEPGGKH